MGYPQKMKFYMSTKNSTSQPKFFVSDQV